MVGKFLLDVLNRIIEECFSKETKFFRIVGNEKLVVGKVGGRVEKVFFSEGSTCLFSAGDGGVDQ